MRNSLVNLKSLLIIHAIISGQVKGSNNDQFFARESEYIENTGKGLMSVYKAKKILVFETGMQGL